MARGVIQMSYTLLVVGSEFYTGTQAAVNAELNSLNVSGAVIKLVSADNTLAGNWAQIWAQGAGVPWIDLGPQLTAVGYDVWRAPVQAILQTQPGSLLTIGTSARTVSATGYCVAASGSVTIVAI